MYFKCEIFLCSGRVLFRIDIKWSNFQAIFLYSYKNILRQNRKKIIVAQKRTLIKYINKQHNAPHRRMSIEQILMLQKSGYFSKIMSLATLRSDMFFFWWSVCLGIRWIMDGVKNVVRLFARHGTARVGT